MQQVEQRSRIEDKSLSDQVGEIAEQSQTEDHIQKAEHTQKEKHTQPENTAILEGERQGTVLRDRREDEPRNPKKRMWEEPMDGSGEKAPRDEL